MGQKVLKEGVGPVAGTPPKQATTSATTRDMPAVSTAKEAAAAAPPPLPTPTAESQPGTVEEKPREPVIVAVGALGSLKLDPGILLRTRIAIARLTYRDEDSVAQFRDKFRVVHHSVLNGNTPYGDEVKAD
jgi:hypothetical protein